MDNFFERVYRIVAQIPIGKVMTYGQIAVLLGNPRGARTVGWAMHGTPSEINLPCHRVVNKSGALSPGCAFGSPEYQKSLLEMEGVTFKEDGTINMDKHIWIPDFEGWE